MTDQQEKATFLNYWDEREDNPEWDEEYMGMAANNEWECEKCGWEGGHSQKVEREYEPGICTHVCPKCGHDSFYNIKP